MKISIILIALAATCSVYAVQGTEDKPVFTQCTVSLPDGEVAGICVEKGGKYYQVYTCEGKSLAFVEPGALPRLDGPTCGPKYKGFKN